MREFSLPTLRVWGTISLVARHDGDFVDKSSEYALDNMLGHHTDGGVDIHLAKRCTECAVKSAPLVLPPRLLMWVKS